MEQKTIAAIATAQGTGGIGVIRISGEHAFAIAERVFRPAGSKKVKEMKGYTAAYGSVYDGEEKLDEGILLVFRAPHSYTGEDVAEDFLPWRHLCDEKHSQGRLSAAPPPPGLGNLHSGPS